MTNVFTPIDSSYKLVFDDEFNGTSLDTNIWSPGWFLQGGSGLSKPANSSEANLYNSDLVSVSGGYAHLKAISSPATLNGVSYPNQTGMLQEKEWKFTYGYFEARIYLPAASPGVIANWPAWWLDGVNWPTDGEIDIMEGLSGRATSTFHSAANPGGLSQAANGDYTGWHVFGAVWKSGEIDFYYDGHLQHTVTTGITSAPMQMLFNNSVGGFGGPLVTPSDMLVDYVHVYQNTPNAVAMMPQAGYGGPGDAGLAGSAPPPPPPPPPVDSPTISIQTRHKPVVTIDGTVAHQETDYGAIVNITSSGVASVALGSTADTMKFIAMSQVSVTGGSARSTLTADAGVNSFSVGKGAMTVTGGAGADAYLFHNGSGDLTVSDFFNGDSLTIDKSLQGAFLETSDGHGGTMISFGMAAGQIDLLHVAPTAITTAIDFQ